MSKKKSIVSAALVVSLGIAWMSCMSGDIKEYAAYRSNLNQAQDSLDKKLYEQAIEYYKSSLEYKCSVKTYQKIEEAYELFYREEPSSYVRTNYIADMEQASSEFPKEEEFWKKQIELYEENEDYSGAYEAAKSAINKNVSGEWIKEKFEDLLYMVETEYTLYYEFKTCLNGYITVNDGNQWRVINNKGEELTGGYNFIGLLNDEGEGIYTNEIDSRLLDAGQVARARFDLEIEEAGYYSGSLECVPVKIDGKWRYLKKDGMFLPGEYEMAGSFYDGEAAVNENGKWFLIDSEGERVSEKSYEEIKLDLYGCHRQGDVIIAKENGNYGLYNEELKLIKELNCEEIDICINNEWIAFKKGKLWGFMNVEGEVVVEPKYEEAKSFSNGMAAVCNKSGKWGFINDDLKQVIGYKYLDAYYYTSDETCMVSVTEGTYQIQKYMFE